MGFGFTLTDNFLLFKLVRVKSGSNTFLNKFRYCSLDNLLKNRDL